MNTPHAWHIFTTADGSPTLIWAREDGYVEKMHHSGGALAESVYIYGSAVADTIRRGWPVHVLSMGLGLGYNELITAAECVRQDRLEWRLTSFESEEPLREGFRAWLHGTEGELSAIHDKVLNGVSAHYGLDPFRLKSLTFQALQQGRIELRGSFPADAPETMDCTCVLYDAYSKKMEESLWEENALVERLRPRLASHCILSTYAATGSMKRALRTLGFRLLRRPGFQGKRESTLAIRE